MLSPMTTTPESQNFTVNIIEDGNQTAGEKYTLICSISLNSNTTAFEWFYQQEEHTNPKANISASSHLEVIDQLLESKIVFSPLHESHTGVYTCQASLENITRESSHVVNVKSMFLGFFLSDHKIA